MSVAPLENPRFSGALGDGNGAVISNFGGLSVGYLTKREICLGVRTSGKAGSGSWDDPYDASTMAKHDAIWRDRVIPVSTPIVRYREDIYETSGSYSYNAVNGFYIPPGCKIYGAGKGSTIIKAMSYPVSAGSAGHNVFESRVDTDGEGIEIRNLTVDCNWQNLSAAVSTRTAAINIAGNNCKIVGVEVKNTYGYLHDLLECFCIGMGSHLIAGVWQNCSGALIEDCDISIFQGDYTSCIIFSGSGDGGFTGTISGDIKNNRIRNLTSGVTAFGCNGKGIRIVDNFTENCFCSFYFDTGHLDDVMIARNVFMNVRRKGIFITPGLGDPQATNVSITDNHIELSDLGPDANVAISVSGTDVANVRIAGNVITKKITGSGTPSFGITCASIDGLVVESNLVDSGHSNNLFEGIADNLHSTVRDNLTEDGQLPAGLGVVTSGARPDNDNSSLDGSLLLQATYTDVDGYIIYSIAQSYTIVSGDYLSYEVFCHEANVAFTPQVTLHFTDTTQSDSIVDQNGLYSASEFGVHAASNISSYAAGAWYRRTCSLEDFVAKIVDKILIFDAPALTGTNKTYFRQIRINTSAGVLKKAFFDEAASPPTIVAGASLHVSNYSMQIAPAKALLPMSITLTQILANTNNYAPAATASHYYLRMSTDASRNITGMVFSPVQVDGQPHLAVNTGAQDIVLKHQDTNSTAANRFLNSSGADITLTANQSADMIYDGTTARWRVFKRN